MQEPGFAWIEDWIGFEEIHFPAKTVDELRISFDGNWIQIDEMEILDASAEGRNVAHQSHGTIVLDNPETRIEGKPTTRLIDSEFGTQSWRAQSRKGNKEGPWLHFKFAQSVTVNTIRLSSNREDFFETDYLDDLNKNQFGDFKIELRDENGLWKAFSSTSSIRQRDKGNSRRQELLAEIDKTVSQLALEGPQTGFLARFIEPVETFVLSRGSPESPHGRVYASAPKLLDGDLGIQGDPPGQERRLAFADWLVNPENPLTARVMANRMWHHIFGTGIVPTPSDFGNAGAPATHPELLDWMAGEFIRSGWSMKGLVRKIVLSRAFRQSSAPDAAGLAKDASAQLLWRFPPRRVEAEVIRDSVLLASGQLDERIGGPSYRIHNIKKRYAQWEVVDNHGEETWRRMLYQERMRRVDDRIFTAFDFPDCGQIRAKRPVSTTPLQALNLMNSEFVVEQAKLLAERASREAGHDPRDQIVRCFELLLTREPAEQELDSTLQFLQSNELALLCRTLINTNEFAFLP